MNDTIGSDFLMSTRYFRGELPNHFLDWSTKPGVFKKYPGSKVIPLPSPIMEDGPGIWQILNKRRSRRAYANDSIPLRKLSQLLWATQGVSGKINTFTLRTAPSAGALYPIETYLSIHRVEDVEPGLYHYDIECHSLEVLELGDFSKEVQGSALDQAIAGKASVVFIWSAVFERSTWKYLQRAYRYIFMDVAHIAQNLALASEALDLGSCQIGAIYDEEINQLLSLSSDKESVIYLTSVGVPIRSKNR